MKQVVIILISLFVSLTLCGQTPFTIENSKESEWVEDDANVNQISLANPWFGAKLSYNLSEKEFTDEDFVFSAKVLYNPIKGEKFAFPIVGSAGLMKGDLLNPESGVNLGVYPYFIVRQETSRTFLLHGGFGYKVMPTSESNPIRTEQTRFLFGVEGAFWGADGAGLPTTLSITPGWVWNSNTPEPNTGFLEASMIFPLSQGLGILINGMFPFNDHYDGTVKIGVIINGQL